MILANYLINNHHINEICFLIIYEPESDLFGYHYLLNVIIL